MPYVDLARFRELTVMPAADVDAIEAAAPGWIDKQAAVLSGQMDARLCKRYAAPFSLPYPASVEAWCVRLLTVRAYMRRGVDSGDQQFALISEDATAAAAEIKEAADSENGLFELPLRANTTATGVSKGGPLAYSESSPYTWTTRQREGGYDG